MKKSLLLLVLFLMSTCAVFAQRKTDALDRGLVAVKVNSGVYVSWRVQADEYYGVNYNLYRNGSLIAQNLVTSNYSDAGGSTSSTYTVAPVKNGVVGTQCAAVSTWAKQYLEIPVSNVQARSGVTVWKQNDPSSAMANYTINDISLGDVDGDGKIDFIVKRKNQTDQDNLFPTNNYQMYCQIECYASSKNYARLWWIDCGPNICYAADEQWDAVAFDWNEDGSCEVLYRGGANTVIHHSDGTTETIGNASENIRGGITHTANMTFTNAGEEWLMYIDGRTGKTYDVISYPLARGKASDWGDSYGHRSSKYFMGAPYLDGQNPYIFLGRGIYTKIMACTYRVNKSTNKLYKVGNTWNSYNNSGWYAQGYHNFAIADVDLDGADEIIYGSMVLDFHTNDTSLHGMASTSLGHGDASHTGDLDPYRRGLETFACNEEKPSFNFRNAATCEIYARSTGSGDDGRAMAGNFTNEYPGGIGASTASGIIPLSMVQSNPYAPTAISEMANNWNAQTPYPMALNFRIYWDGDLLSETINGPGSGENYLFVDKLGKRIFDTNHGNYETATINGTKKNPCATGDILGDWREEIVVRSADNRFIRVYTTVTPTEHRMPSLWYDHQYRQAMVWQTEGYNQPPHPSFFVGELEGLTQAPPPLTWTGRNKDYNGELRGSLIGGKDVLIMTNGNGQERSIKVNANACPSTLFLNSRTTVEGGDQVTYKETKRTFDRIRFTGEPFTGTTNICKQGASATHLVYGNHTHSGKTDVWDGALICNGSMPYSPIWANLHTELFLGNSLDAAASTYKSIDMEYGSALYITSQAFSTPYTNNNGYAHMSVGNLTLKEGARIVFDLNGANNASGDKLDITNLTVRKRTWKYGPKYSAPIFELRANGSLAAGEYELGAFGTVAEGSSIDDIVLEIPSGKNGSVAHLYVKDKKYYLHIGNSKYTAPVEPQTPTTNEGESNLTPDMFMEWTGTNASATAKGTAQCDYVLNASTGLPYGDVNVYNTHYADLSAYAKLEVTATAGEPRFCFNRVENTGNVPIEFPRDNGSLNYETVKDNGNGSKTYTIDLAAMVAEKGFAHLNCIKGANWANVTITSMKLVGKSQTPSNNTQNGSSSGSQNNNTAPTNEIFSLAQNAVNPSIWETGKYTYNSSTGIGTLYLGQYGFGGWRSDNGYDLSRYESITITFAEAPSSETVFRLFKDNNYWGSNAIEVSCGNKTSVTMNISDINKAYIAGFWNYGNAASNGVVNYTNRPIKIKSITLKEKTANANNSTMFSLAQGAVNPSIWETGQYTYNSSAGVGTLYLGQYGFGGWKNDNGYDISNYESIVITFAEAPSSETMFRLFSENNYWGGKYVEVACGNKTSVTLNVSAISKAYIVGFWNYGNAASNGVVNYTNRPIKIKSVTLIAKSSGAKTIQFADDATTVSSVSDDATPLAIYNIHGVKQTKMQKGVNILMMSNGMTKKVVVK